MKDTDSIQHVLTDNPLFPNSFRDSELFRIINDLDEENMGWGWSEVERTPPSPFVDKITTYDDDPGSGGKKRTETIFTRTGAFVSQITKNVYDQDGTTIKAVITADVTRTGNSQVNIVNVQVTRP